VQGPERIRTIGHIVQRLGPLAAMLYFCQSYRQQFVPPHSPFALRSRRAMYPLYCRPGTSDWDVFKQVFIDWQYDDPYGTHGPEWVIDCGANVGYASAWFLSVYPSCNVIAVEPDLSNYECLVRTLRPYGARARAIHGAVWSHDTTVALAREPYGDGREWARHVQPDGDGVRVPAYSLPSIFAHVGIRRAALVKMDIEGAETVLFRDHPEQWLGDVDSLAIELHRNSPFGDPTALFERAMLAAGLSWRTRGETTICKRL
jgi:FkbM family methyltransferase